MARTPGLRHHSGVRRGCWLGIVAIAIGCGDPERDEDDGVGSFPTGLSNSDSTGSASADDGPEKLDLQSMGDAGSDPDGPNVCEEDVDIVFVMDVSTSMGPFLDKLAQEILVVDQALQTLQLPSEPHYGLVVFVDDFALLNSGQPYADVAALQADFQMWSTFTASNSQVAGGNLNSTWPENSLDALFAGANGFAWRNADSTLRMIIHTTDDTFWDGPTTGNGVEIQRGYAETVDKLQEREIRDFSFAAQLGSPCECEDVTMGWSSDYLGMPSIPVSTDGNVYDIDLVLANQVSLSDAIFEAVEDSICDPYTPQG